MWENTHTKCVGDMTREHRGRYGQALLDAKSPYDRCRVGGLLGQRPRESG